MVYDCIFNDATNFVAHFRTHGMLTADKKIMFKVLMDDVYGITRMAVE